MKSIGIWFVVIFFGIVGTLSAELPVLGNTYLHDWLMTGEVQRLMNQAQQDLYDSESQQFLFWLKGQPLETSTDSTMALLAKSPTIEQVNTILASVENDMERQALLLTLGQDSTVSDSLRLTILQSISHFVFRRTAAQTIIDIYQKKEQWDQLEPYLDIAALSEYQKKDIELRLLSKSDASDIEAHIWEFIETFPSRKEAVGWVDDRIKKQATFSESQQYAIGVVYQYDAQYGNAAKWLNPIADYEDVPTRLIQVAYQQGKFSETIEQVHHFQKRFPNHQDTPDWLLYEARALRKLDRMDEAKEKYYYISKHYKKYAKTDDILWLLALLEEGEGNYKAAASFYYKLFKHYPQSSSAIESQYRYALMQIILKHNTKAEKTLLKLSSFDHDFLDDTFYWLSRICDCPEMRGVYAERLQKQYPNYFYTLRYQLQNETIIQPDFGTLALADLPTPDSLIYFAIGEKLAKQELAVGNTVLNHFLAVNNHDVQKQLAAAYYLSLHYLKQSNFFLSIKFARELQKQIELFDEQSQTIIYRLTYPVAFATHFFTENRSLDEILTYLSLSRQESWFHPTIKSSANARGLMQLLPQTARQVAGKLNVDYSLARLHHPEYNIQLGIHYLQMLADSLNEKTNLPPKWHSIFVYASYNAGFTAAQNWMNNLESIPYEELIYEHLGYRETRRYAQRIWSGKQIYQKYWSF